MGSLQLLELKFQLKHFAGLALQALGQLSYLRLVKGLPLQAFLLCHSMILFAAASNRLGEFGNLFHESLDHSFVSVGLLHELVNPSLLLS
mmetsp:Transcript_18731/g.28742  ORF Transcript_18731/g.28742 Transcript_18731/m.28742 type:complete len:90 (-) Transcript_18731:214-483(-)